MALNFSSPAWQGLKNRIGQVGGFISNLVNTARTKQQAQSDLLNYGIKPAPKAPTSVQTPYGYKSPAELESMRSNPNYNAKLLPKSPVAPTLVAPPIIESNEPFVSALRGGFAEPPAVKPGTPLIAPAQNAPAASPTVTPAATPAASKPAAPTVAPASGNQGGAPPAPTPTFENPMVLGSQQNAPAAPQIEASAPGASGTEMAGGQGATGGYDVGNMSPEQRKALQEAEKNYEDSLKISPEELSTQEDIDKLNESAKKAYQNTQDQAIPLEFITGQQKSLEARALALQEPLERKLARLQATRTSSLEASKFAIERADKKAAEYKPQSVAPGTSLVKLNPTTGKYESIFTAPKEISPADQPSSVKEYEYAKSQGYTGTYEQFKNGGGNDNPDRVLSATEAQALGVPFGTKAGEAYGKTPQKPLTEAQSKDLTYGARSEEANSYIQNLEKTVAGYNPVSWMAATAAENTTIGNAFVSPEIKQIRQAERNFITAVLRRESGAAISPSEFAVADKQYFPRPGDDAKTLQQKAQNRQTAIDAFKMAGSRGGGNEGGSGQTINTPYGEINPNL